MSQGQGDLLTCRRHCNDILSRWNGSSSAVHLRAAHMQMCNRIAHHHLAHRHLPYSPAGPVLAWQMRNYLAKTVRPRAQPASAMFKAVLETEHSGAGNATYPKLSRIIWYKCRSVNVKMSLRIMAAAPYTSSTCGSTVRFGPVNA